MARCNIFKPLSNPTGEFLMFSQFAEDVTKSTTDGPMYRVVPSKFACLDLKTDGLKGVDDRPADDYNVALPKVFQNFYENSLAVFKERYGTEWIPSYANNLLWNTLISYGLITKSEVQPADTSTRYTYPELKYVGEIPFYNNRAQDDMNYNEIYCHVPVSAEHTTYINREESREDNFEELPFTTDPQSKVKTYDTWICGWTGNSYPANLPHRGTPIGLVKQGDEYIPAQVPVKSHVTLASDLLYPLQYADIPQSLTSDKDLIFFSEKEPYRYKDSSTQEWLKPDEFTFNSIIVFYDIYNIIYPKDGEPQTELLYKNIPMGIYITGPFVKNKTTGEQTIKNHVTKYVTNVDAFGQGSSYGLRIMTRITPTPNSTVYFAEVAGGQDTASLSTMMGQMGDMISDMREMMRRQSENSQDVKDHLAMFKNYRINVPYIRVVNGVDTWFVNGRNTGVRATGLQGAMGVQGLMGIQGSKGATGQSIVGPQGPTGPVGTQGAMGIQGIPGVGAQGAAGKDGAQGAQGAQGAAGRDGATQEPVIPVPCEIFLKIHTLEENPITGKCEIETAEGVYNEDTTLSTKTGKSMTFRADPYPGYAFDHWDISYPDKATVDEPQILRARGSNLSTDPTIAIPSISGNTQIVAYFTSSNVEVTYNDVSKGGTVDCAVIEGNERILYIEDQIEGGSVDIVNK